VGTRKAIRVLFRIDDDSADCVIFAGFYHSEVGAAGLASAEQLGLLGDQACVRVPIVARGTATIGTFAKYCCLSEGSINKAVVVIRER
jgi:hypothetical protein